MYLSELIQKLEEIQHDLGEVDPEVFLAYQPAHPLSVEIGQVVGNDEQVFIAEADYAQNEYLEEEIEDELGWSK